MKRKISILGSTGSIGRQTLDVVRAGGDTVLALTANRDAARMEEQCREFRPELAVMMDPEAAADLRVRLADTDIRVLEGMEGLIEAATIPKVDTVVTAVVGIVGLRPTIAAIQAGKRIALANKETLVCAGELVMKEAERWGAQIVPVDSEHSAIFQCLQGCADHGEVKRILLTASGGPFWGKTRAELETVTLADALKHPNWSMGAKITVDSATMMNKGLELIEAMRLYRLSAEKICVVVHRESIIHSAVEYCDNAVIAQLGVPDMRLPIQYALTWPERGEAVAKPLDLFACGTLTFAPPDEENFPCLALARRAAAQGGTATAILNGANEAAVGRFLAGEIGFMDIPRLVERAMEHVPAGAASTLEDVFEADRAARAWAAE
ncbi:1-deoxy-D-xylulose-5-phosphate reductoisomerase [Flavonifractor sp. An92]|uniref:1-deoxy-D-xylulose-5-phosphate reductoisomerase n=1 Tax=Flavonifractor sp. An92 TaxID=1965666 RepID=UPI000B56B9F2|nr:MULTISPECIES: 1-deoxy-D-xylulose-5-phosphate reductoisomerase [unclassified Flavonifractor]OUN06492.1 1-deoxy-D-xylulose-5-phosphate reductoisomerase [Flavonifractor sp. An92]OUQ25173.1 1-deoxy-D-xylulose-5-phosphate reductoisomerase [Flavonifractor sp. An135]